VTGGPEIRFYAGAVIQDANGFTLGSLCVIDTNQDLMNRKCIKIVGKSSCFIVDLRKKFDLKYPIGISELSNLVCIANLDGTYHKVNPAFTTVLGY
jgi:hypothetical protein